jgi:hypothetical protein
MKSILKIAYKGFNQHKVNVSLFFRFSLWSFLLLSA